MARAWSGSVVTASRRLRRACRSFPTCWPSRPRGSISPPGQLSSALRSGVAAHRHDLTTAGAALKLRIACAGRWKIRMERLAEPVAARSGARHRTRLLTRASERLVNLNKLRISFDPDRPLSRGFARVHVASGAFARSAAAPRRRGRPCGWSSTTAIAVRRWMAAGHRALSRRLKAAPAEPGPAVLTSAAWSMSPGDECLTIDTSAAAERPRPGPLWGRRVHRAPRRRITSLCAVSAARRSRSTICATGARTPGSLRRSGPGAGALVATESTQPTSQLNG